MHNVTTREKTCDEVENEIQQLDFVEHPAVRIQLLKMIDNWMFTDETFSLCFDVGMYLGEVFRRSLPGVKWSYHTKLKNSNVNKPILEGFFTELPPIDLVLVFAAKIYERTASSGELIRLYDWWVNNYYIKPSP
jgi:hypothetical protein